MPSQLIQTPILQLPQVWESFKCKGGELVFARSEDGRAEGKKIVPNHLKQRSFNDLLK